MVFHSSVFALFFVGVYIACLFTMRRFRLQNVLLLFASCLFYGWWDWRFLGLLLASTIIDFFCARAIDLRRTTIPGAGVQGVERHPESLLQASSTIKNPGEGAIPFAYSPQFRKQLLIVSIVSNLGILGFFKYFDFFATSASRLLTSVGLPSSPFVLRVILPVGISFYTFQALSYTIDVYRGRLRAVENIIDFQLFVTFFPQLVAGPIVRAADLLPQIHQARTLNWAQTSEGAYLILWGLFKKAVIADNLAPMVDRTFSSPMIPGGGEVLLSLYAFAVQIYCDFSGYSDIARGCAKMMGFELALNFNLPYFAANPAEFWRRWHISLSTWLRDYLYIPLGGNRKGPKRTCINLGLTMLLGGLWHGAAWTFVLWGAYQGGLLIAHRLMMPVIDRWSADRSPRQRSLGRAAAIFGFFHLTCLGWLLFRAESAGQAVAMFLSMLKPWNAWIASGSQHLFFANTVTLLLYSSPLVVMQLIQYLSRDLNVIFRLPSVARGLCYGCLIYAFLVLTNTTERPFIYFQF